MFTRTHLPAAILCLTILSAVAILAGGWQFAKVETKIPVERDRAPLTSFTTSFLEEVRSLETLYFNHLDDIRGQIQSHSSRISVDYVCRNIIGIEQASLLTTGRGGFSVDLREGDRSTPLPEPYLTGESDNRLEPGLIINPDTIDWQAQWLEQPGHPPHYAVRIAEKRFLVLRINTDQTAAAMDRWLKA